MSRLGPTLRSLRYPARRSSSFPLPNLDRRAFTGAGGPPGPFPVCRRVVAAPMAAGVEAVEMIVASTIALLMAVGLGLAIASALRLALGATPL